MLRIITCMLVIASLCFQTLNAQKEEPSYPDTSYLMDQIYRIDVDSVHVNWGFYDMKTLEWLTDPIYDSLIYRYRTGIELAYYEIRKNGKWGLLKADRKPWIEPIYKKIDYEFTMTPRRIFVEKGTKFGILNEDGTNWLAPIYDEILYDGYYFKVSKDGKWGMLDHQGEEFMPICYEEIYEHKTPEMSLIRTSGNEKSWSIFLWVRNTENPCQTVEKYSYERIEYFNEFFSVYKNGKWGLVDRKGDFVLPLEYESLKPFVFSYLRLLKAKKNGKYGLLAIDSLNKVDEIAPIVYDEIYIDEDSYKIKIEQNGKRDYLYNEEPYFGLTYEDVYYFLSYRLFTIKKGKKLGIAREDKEILIAPSYDRILFLDAKTYMVKKGKKWGIINSRNEEVIPIEFTEFDYRVEEGYFFAAKGKNWGIVSLKKGIILPAKYEDVMVLPDRNFMVLKKGKTGIVGPQGRVIVPLEYDDFKMKRGSNSIELVKKDGPNYNYKLRR